MQISEYDLNQLTTLARNDLEKLAGAHVFLTGGTGYIGRWLLEGICFANQKFGLKAKVTVLSRSPVIFAKTFPHLSHDSAVRLIEGDIRSFQFPAGYFTHAVHAATDVLTVNPQLETFDVIVAGTKRLLDFCSTKNIRDVLILSSGAVYGPIPSAIKRVPETYNGAPLNDAVKSAYGIGKLAAEWLATGYSAEKNMSCKVARIFAQIGPHLALDKQFAAGNFILNAMKGERFVIKGDGTPLRSYMYGTDLFVWLIRILINGVAGRAYNVGSNYAISISDLANLIAKAAGIVNPKLDIREKPSAQKHLERYVPDISRAENELELNVTVGLEDAIERTLHWFRLYESSH